MSELKRIPVKYIRDYIKRDYKLKDYCYICGSEENLELHHIYSLSECWNNWCIKNNIDNNKISTVDEINELRQKFQQDCQEDLANENLYTLCKMHHQRLHNIYGQRYGNHMAEKVKRWLDIQRDKGAK